LPSSWGKRRTETARFYVYEIHVWSFYEAKYDVEEVKYVLPYVEWLLQYTKKALAHER